MKWYEWWGIMGTLLVALPVVAVVMVFMWLAKNGKRCHKCGKRLVATGYHDNMVCRNPYCSTLKWRAELEKRNKSQLKSYVSN